jgi:phosphatidylglycerol:prolipoprotein diacylglycerol transferase
MINFLHTFTPNSILISFGPFNIFYYGVLIVLGILLGSFLLFHLAKPYGISKDTLIDSAFYIVLSAIAGGRIYHVFLEWQYYLEHPLNIFMLWRGGLAIHGAIITGLLAIVWFAKKNKLNPLLLTSLYVPALALGQAIGRWGNYFNQELFGLPTNLPWGIPIDYLNRVQPFLDKEYFHPTFLYESVGNLLIFFLLFWLHKKIKYYTQDFHIFIICTYLFTYSLLRFSLEFIRIDQTITVFGLRWPQYMSLILMTVSIYLIYKNKNLIKKKKPNITEN